MKKTKRHCRCGRTLRVSNKGTLCHRCRTRQEREELMLWYGARGTTPHAEDVAQPIRAQRIPMYCERAQKGLPLFG